MSHKMFDWAYAGLMLGKNGKCPFNQFWAIWAQWHGIFLYWITHYCWGK